MANSYAETLTLTCAVCGRDFDAKLWLIVDASEQPELLEHIRSGTIHDTQCSHCGDSGHIDAPLLLYRPKDVPTILYSPAERTSINQDREQERQLAELLRANLGIESPKEQMGILWLHRGDLSAILSNAMGTPERSPAEQNAVLELLKIKAELAARGSTISNHPDLLARWEAATAVIGIDGGLSTPAQFTNEVRQAREAKQRYLQTGDQAALAVARASYERILHDSTFTSTNEQFQLYTLDKFAHVLMDCYNEYGRIDDINLAIELGRETVNRDSVVTPTPSLRMGYLTNLGIGLLIRYKRTTDLSDLDEAIALFEEAISGEQHYSSSRSNSLNDLSSAFRARYIRTGELALLDQAIRILEQAVDGTAHDSPQLPMYLHNLGNSLHDRYERTKDTVDLVEAIQVSREAVLRTESGSPDLPLYLNGLGVKLLSRSAFFDDSVDIAEAIISFRRAVEWTRSDSKNLHGFLHNLGVGLREAYMRSCDLNDLAEAIRVFQQSVQRTPADAPDLAYHLMGLGVSLSDRFERIGDPVDLEEARTCYRLACLRGQDVAPGEVLGNARNWVNWALERNAWIEAIEAYDFGRQAVELLFASQINRRNKELWLREAQGLPANAAYALAKLGKPKDAVVALETGCARLLAEVLEQKRRDLEHLSEVGRGDLLERYNAASQRVANLKYQVSNLDAQQVTLHAPSPPFEYSAWRQQMETARVELKAVIDAICDVEIDGQKLYANLFLPPTFGKIKQAATPDAPLVYLATTAVGSVALVVHADQTPVAASGQALRVSTVKDAMNDKQSATDEDHEREISMLWLDDLTEAGMRQAITGPSGGGSTMGRYLGKYNAFGSDRHVMEIKVPTVAGYLGAYDRWRRNVQDDETRQTWHDTLRDTTHWIWTMGMGHVVEHLREMGAQHAVLIPVGLLNLLPLHAAWTEDPSTPTGRRYAMDVVNLSYSPSAAALHNAREVASTVAASSMLAVSEPSPTGGEPLHYSGHEVTAAIDTFDRHLLLQGPEATRPGALSALPEYSVAHFSCHAFANFDEPLAGGLVMAGNERLTIGDLLDQRLPGLRLAVLSACETGVPADFKIPDEVVSLPTGLLQAGAAGVVASLWSLVDVSTAMLMFRFYDLWRNQGLEPQQALPEAQQWVRDTTNAEKEDYFESFLPDLGGTNNKMPALAAKAGYQAVVLLEPEVRDFAHPYFWAAFTYTGV